MLFWLSSKKRREWALIYSQLNRNSSASQRFNFPKNPIFMAQLTWMTFNFTVHRIYIVNSICQRVPVHPTPHFSRPAQHSIRSLSITRKIGWIHYSNDNEKARKCEKVFRSPSTATTQCSNARMEKKKRKKKSISRQLSSMTISNSPERSMKKVLMFNDWTLRMSVVSLTIGCEALRVSCLMWISGIQFNLHCSDLLHCEMFKQRWTRFGLKVWGRSREWIDGREWKS